MGASGGKAAAYARTIERYWTDLLEQAVVLSPQDWSWVRRWHEHRIPLDLVREALAAANERDPARARPRRLAEVARAVEESWQVVLDGRRSRDSEVSGPLPVDPVRLWRRRLQSEPAGSGLAELLAELLGRFDAGSAASELDAELDDRLPDAVPESLRRNVEEELEPELEPYRSRMPTPRWDATRRSATVERLRRRLELPLLETGSPRA
jgi:hypothetical protein